MTDNASNNLTFLQAVQNTATGFNIKNQHVRCLAHVINLTAQQILRKLNAENIIELENTDEQVTEKTAGQIIYKVSLY